MNPVHYPHSQNPTAMSESALAQLADGSLTAVMRFDGDCGCALPKTAEQQAHARLRCFREEAERRGRQPARSTVRTSSSSSTSTTLASPSGAAQGGLLAAKGLGRAVSHAAAKKRDDDRLWRQAIGEATKGMRRGFGSASGGATAARMARRTAPLSTRSDQGAVAQSV